MREISNALAETWVSQFLASLSWFVPTVQTVHILAIAVVASSVVLHSVTLMRYAGTGASVPDWIRGTLPWIWRALIALLASGLLLILAEPARELLSALFWIKMALVLVLSALLAVIQHPLRTDPAFWAAPRRHVVAVLLGGTFLVVLLVIVWAGRFIAYM